MSADAVVDDLVERITLGRTHEELLDRLFERLRGLVPYDRIAVAVLEQDGTHLGLVSCRSDGALALKIGYAAPVAGSTLEPLLKTGAPRILNDLPAYLAGKPSSTSTRLIVREGMHANLTLPLLAEGRAIGVVFFSSRETNVYRPEHVVLLRRLAGPLAISIEKARLLAALDQQNRELQQAAELKERFLERLQAEVERQTAEVRRSEERYRLLAALGRLLNASLDLREVFGRAAEEVRRLTTCDRVSLIRAGASADWREGFAVEFAPAARWVEVPRRPLADSAIAWVLEKRRPRLVRDLRADRPFPEDRRLFDQGYRAYVYLPLVCRGQGVGVLGVAAREVGRVDGWDIALLGEVSEVLAAALHNAAAYGEIVRLKGRLEDENEQLREEVRGGDGELVGSGQAMDELRRAVRQVAATDSTVLLLGETGVGKELVARAIHRLSPRRDKLLVAVHCAALSPALLPSELFGHEAGAFTGATRRRLGRFELAHRGSLFLDEIGELSPETQVLLLRALQERTIERVGGHEPIAVDVRILAATNRDLDRAQADGSFRPDLFYRLNVFPIRVPPLRERREDIPALIEHFVGVFARRMAKPITTISRRTLELAAAYHWPGNVRELEHLVERATIVSGGDTLDVDPAWLRSAPVPPTAPERGSLAEQERQTILDALHRSGGKIYGPDGAAAALGLKPTTLYGKLTRHRIRKRPGATTFE